MIGSEVMGVITPYDGERVGMRLRSLAQAQMLDVTRNPLLVLFWGLVPILGFAMKAAMPEDAMPILSSTLFLMSAYFVGWNLPAQTMAEGKEKRVLEALLLTPVRPWQVVLVNAALGTVASLLLGVVMLLVLGQVPTRPMLWLAGYLLAVLFTVSGGTLTGLLFKDMRSLALGGTPIMLLLIFATVLPWQIMQPGFWAVQAWLPTRPLAELIQAGYLGDDVPVLQNVLVMLGYVAALWVANARLLRRMAVAGR